MELYEWHKVDDDGLVMPWLTHPSLEEIKRMDLSYKIVWMWGAGMGDAWLAKRCEKLYVVERNSEWLYKSQEMCQMNNIQNITYFHRPCNDCSGMDGMYCEIPDGIIPDVFIVDDAYRYECIVMALEFSPCTLIVDNWWQDYIFMCPAATELLKDYEQKIFEQEDHKHHEGNKWKTAVFYIK